MYQLLLVKVLYLNAYTHKEVKSKINKLSFEFKKIEEKRKINHKISRMEEISEQNSMK